MKFAAYTAVAYLSFLAIVLIGWFMNIINLVNSTETIATMSVHGVMQIVGVFIPPIGAAMAFFF